MLKKILTCMMIFCLVLGMTSCKKEKTESPVKENGTMLENIEQETTDHVHHSDRLSDETELKQNGPNDSSKKQIIGISKGPLIEAYTDDWGIKLSAKNITPTRLTLLCEQEQGEPKGELASGFFYTLEKLENGHWTELKPLIPKEEMAFNDEILQILPSQITEYNVDWTSFYGTLNPGHYRIGKQIMDVRSVDDFDEKMYYAAFDLIEADADTKICYEHDGFGLNLPYIAGFEYSVEEFTDTVMLLGTGEYFRFSFRPLNEQGEIMFSYYKNFGLCGTGLETKDYGEGQMAVYDGNPDWDFIIYPASEGYFVVMNRSSGEWLNTYRDQVMQIIDHTERIDPGR